MRGGSLSLLFVFALAACSGGGGGSPIGTPSTPAPPPPPGNGGTTTIPTHFVIGAPPSSTSALSSSRSPQYVPTTVQSVTITLDTVNAASPPSGLTTTATDNISAPSCPCVVNGPSVPPGSDGFTITTYDHTGGTGNAISVATPTIAITAGTTNNVTITLAGIPKTLAISGIPSASAGTALAATALSVAAKDADGNTITGPYASPITLADGDTTGASTFATSGSDSPPTRELLSSTDTATLAYTGLAILPATLTASATGATNGTATFTPTLQPIVYSGPLNGSTPEIDLYATSGFGSTFSYNVSEAGWTNSPYGKALSLNASACSTFATASAGVDVPASGTPITVTAIASPSAGTCTMTVSDPFGQTKSVTGTYTVTGIGIQ
ncbi:MAG: hypothetical protein HKL92_05605 [Candidatus Eremiobacteraeota bacterium]|nr:hypothetical protein [Candidatus Eremiobacteraeota bacterium]